MGSRGTLTQLCVFGRSMLRRIGSPRPHHGPDGNVNRPIEGRNAGNPDVDKALAVVRRILTCKDSDFQSRNYILSELLDFGLSVTTGFSVNRLLSLGEDVECPRRKTNPKRSWSKPHFKVDPFNGGWISAIADKDHKHTPYDYDSNPVLPFTAC